MFYIKKHVNKNWVFLAHRFRGARQGGPRRTSDASVIGGRKHVQNCYDLISFLFCFIWIYTVWYGFMMASWCYISCFGFEVLIILISSCYISWKQTWLNIGSVHFGCAREGLLTSGEGILMVSSQLCLVTIRINHLWIRWNNQTGRMRWIFEIKSMEMGWTLGWISMMVRKGSYPRIPSMSGWTMTVYSHGQNYGNKKSIYRRRLSMIEKLRTFFFP